MTQISPDLSFLISYIRGQYAKLLTIEDFESLINKPYEAFINEIKSFDIGERLKKEPSYKSHEIERFLTSKLIDQHDFIFKNSPNWSKDFLESYATKFEVINIQRIIRYLYAKADINLREVINLRGQELLGRTALISRLLQSKDLSELIDKLKESEYEEGVVIAEKLFKRIEDIWPFEFAIESFYLKQLMNKAQKLKRSQRDGALLFVKNEIFKNLLLVILKADFVEIDVNEAMRLLTLPEEFPFKGDFK